MKKKMDKLLSKIKLNKKLFIFLIVISLIALISGSLLVVLLDKTDKQIVTNYLTNFIDNISKNKIEYKSTLINSLISNIALILGIWLLGISVIGIPIIIFLYFTQIFTFGFALGTLILNYKFKGIILAFIYTFPNYLILFSTLLVLVSYSIILSIKLITTIIKRKQIDFKIISNKYLLILLFSIISGLVFSLYETFALPNIIKLIIPILK